MRTDDKILMFNSKPGAMHTPVVPIIPTTKETEVEDSNSRPSWVTVGYHAKTNQPANKKKKRNSSVATT